MEDILLVIRSAILLEHHSDRDSIHGVFFVVIIVIVGLLRMMIAFLILLEEIHLFEFPGTKLCKVYLVILNLSELCAKEMKLWKLLTA